MPTYDFECECGKIVEELRTISKRNDPKLCECGKKMTRLIGGGSGLIFKGPGFYVNDYPKSEGGADENTS